MDLTGYNNLFLLTAVLYGEARGETLPGKIAVACVIRNRVEHPGWWGKNYKGVILKPKQFSCMSQNDANFDDVAMALGDGLIKEMAWRECRWAAMGAIGNWYGDITNGANHYHTSDVSPPPWSKGKDPVCVLGKHLFYKL